MSLFVERHTLEHNVLGSVYYNTPMRFVFHYADGTTHAFENVMVMQAMKTGCYVLFDHNDRVVVVPPKHRYIVEEPMP